jgi:hypothetical protein
MVPGCSRTRFLCEIFPCDPERNLLYLLTEDGGSQSSWKCGTSQIKKEIAQYGNIKKKKLIIFDNKICQ